MVPRRTVAPADPVVSLSDMKNFIRASGDFEDMVIQQALDAAVAHLDGYRGVLGRGIMPQTWAVDLPRAGTFRLPLPDVVSATASIGTVDLCRDALGALVTVSEAATVTFAVAMPAETVPAVQKIVKLLAAHWLDHRSAGADVRISEVPLGYDALLAPPRWVRV